MIKSNFNKKRSNICYTSK